MQTKMNLYNKACKGCRLRKCHFQQNRHFNTHAASSHLHTNYHTMKILLRQSKVFNTSAASLFRECRTNPFHATHTHTTHTHTHTHIHTHIHTLNTHLQCDNNASANVLDAQIPMDIMPHTHNHTHTTNNTHTQTCSFMTSPHAGAPTTPVPTFFALLSSEPTLRGFS